MLLSFFWGCQVIVNVAHVTTSGTIASWWFGGRGAGPAVGVGSDAQLVELNVETPFAGCHNALVRAAG